MSEKNDVSEKKTPNTLPPVSFMWRKILKISLDFLLPLCASVTTLLIKPEIDARLGTEYSVFAATLLIIFVTLSRGPAPGMTVTVFFILLSVVKQFTLVITIPAFALRELPIIAEFGFILALLKHWIEKKHVYSSKGHDYFRSLAQHSIHPIVVKDKKGKILYASASITNLFGYKPSELSGKSITEFVHQEDRKKVEDFYADIAQKPKKKSHIELRVKKKDSSLVWMRNDALNLMYDDDVKGIVASFQDISRQKLLDEQRLSSLESEKSARKIAEEAVRARDEFLSIASHELKTPLTTIVLQLQTTLRRILTQSLADFSGEKLVKSLTIAGSQSQRLSDLIKDLLNVSLISTGRMELKKEKADLTELVQGIIDKFSDQIQLADTHVKLVAHEPVAGTWDIVRIEQCITNLLTNALKYGKGKPITISVRSKDATAFVSVQDQGEGISEKNQQTIFEAFKRVTQNNNIKGLGVGLFIAKKIAEEHGGTIFVKSQEDKGSTFMLQVPLN